MKICLLPISENVSRLVAPGAIAPGAKALVLCIYEIKDN